MQVMREAIRVSEVERHMFTAGIGTYLITWKLPDKVGVRYNGKEVTLSRTDIVPDIDH